MKPQSKIIAAPGATVLIPLFRSEKDSAPVGFVKLSDLSTVDSAYDTSDFATDLEAAIQAQGIDPASDLGVAVANLVGALTTPVVVTAAEAQETLAWDESNYMTTLVDAVGHVIRAATSGVYIDQATIGDSGFRVKSYAHEVDFDNGDIFNTVLTGAIEAGCLLLGVSLTVDRDLISDQLITVSGTNGNLVLTIDGVDYTEAFDTSATVTVQNFLTTHGAALLAAGIIAVEESAAVIKISSNTLVAISDANSTGDMAGVVTVNASFDLGLGSGDVDAFGAAIALTAGVLGAGEVVSIEDTTLTSPLYFTAADDIALAGDVTTFGGGKVTVTVVMLDVRFGTMNP